MFRILIIAALFMVGIQQGMARGDIDLGKGDRNVVVELRAHSAEIINPKCCDKEADTVQKPSFCKSDCKAVLPGVTLKPYVAPRGHPLVALVDKVSDTERVHLRPPIS